MLSSVSAQARTLNQTVQQALSSNPVISAAQREHAATGYELREARAGYFPTIEIEAATGHERSNNTTTRARAGRGVNEGGHRSLWRNEASLSLNQMVWDGWETHSNVSEQRARLKSAGHSLFETKEGVALDAVEAHLELLRLTQVVDLAEENLDKHQTYLDQITARVQGGRGSQANVRQAEGRAALAESTLEAFRLDLADAQAAYVRIVGDLPEADLQPVVAPVSDVPAAYEEVLESALESSPAMKAAESDVEAAKAALKGSKASFYPRLDLEISAARNENLNGVEGANNEALALARLSYDLYTGGADTARKRQEIERFAASRYELENARREVTESLKQFWNAYKYAKKRLAALQQHVTSSVQTRDAYQKQFDLGQRSLLDLLDSEVEHFNASVSLINEKYTHIFAAYGIFASMGALSERFTTQLASTKEK